MLRLFRNLPTISFEGNYQNATEWGPLTHAKVKENKAQRCSKESHFHLWRRGTTMNSPDTQRIVGSWDETRGHLTPGLRNLIEENPASVFTLEAVESRNHSQINTNDTKKLGASPTVQHHILPGPTSSNHATTWARFRLNFQVAVPRHWQGLAPNKVLTNSLGNLPWYGGRQAPNVQKLKRLQKEWKCLIGIDTCSVLGPFISVASGAFDFISSDLDPYVWNSTALVNGPKSELQKVLPSFLCVRQKFQLQIHALRSWPSLAGNSALREFGLSMFKS